MKLTIEELQNIYDLVEQARIRIDCPTPKELKAFADLAELLDMVNSKITINKPIF